MGDTERTPTPSAGSGGDGGAGASTSSAAVAAAPAVDTAAPPPAAEDSTRSLTSSHGSNIEPDPELQGVNDDDADEDEGYAATMTTSFVTSLASEIRRGVEENGRLYASYGIHKPWIPIDESELDRNDLQHCKFKLLLNDRLFLAPIGDSPQKILDLGTGSGIWAIDVADLFPSAEVIGVDTAPTQPQVLPPNLTFEIDDVEHPWLWKEQTFDFIYARELIMAVRDWPRLLRQAYSRLKPGGWIELAGSVPAFKSDDNTLPSPSAYVELGLIYFEMSKKVGAPGDDPTRWKQHLIDGGYTNVVERIFKIPTNSWPKDERLKRIGMFELEQFCYGIPNIFARGYTEILGGDPVQIEVTLAKARKEVMNRQMHSWIPFYVVYGQRPE